VPIGVQCTDGSGNPAAPDAAPTYRVYGTGSAALATGSVPPKDPANDSGFFEGFLRLGQLFSAGVYSVVYGWTTGSGGHTGGDLDTFEVLPGGDPAGAVIGMYFFPRPQANFIVQQLDSGAVRVGKNPSW